MAGAAILMPLLAVLCETASTSRCMGDVAVQVWSCPFRYITGWLVGYSIKFRMLYSVFYNIRYLVPAKKIVWR